MAAGRRGHGEGSIFKRQDGRWVGQLDVGWTEGGQRKRRSFYGVTRAAVRDAMTEAINAQRQGLTVQSKDQTMATYLRTWLAGEVDDLRPSTHKRYAQFVNRDIIPAIGKISLAKLGVQDVQRMLRGVDAAPRTVRQLRAVLRKALHDAMRMELLSRNVAALAKPPKLGDAVEQPVMEPDQAREFMAAVAGDRLESLYVLALSTGLRQGEALGLQWTGIAGGAMTISKGLQRVNGKLVLVDTKTDASKRTVRLPRVAVEALADHRGRQLEDRLIAGEKWQDTGFVFTSLYGAPLDGTVVTHQLQRLLSKAGLRRMRFHDLRHCAASLMAATGVPALVAMETLGHSNIATTMNIYSHALESSKGSAADAMDGALGG